MSYEVDVAVAGVEPVALSEFLQRLGVLLGGGQVVVTEVRRFPMVSPPALADPPPPKTPSTPDNGKATAPRPAARAKPEEAIEHVRMSCVKTGGKAKPRLAVMITLSPEMFGRLGFDLGKRVVVSDIDAKGRLSLRLAKRGERGHLPNKPKQSRRPVIWLNGQDYGVTTHHASTPVVHEIDLEHGRLLITVPTWMSAPAPAPAQSMTPHTAPPATTIVTPAPPPPIGRQVYLKCATCEEDSTFECKSCGHVYCAACWKTHTRAHLAGTVHTAAS